MIRNSSIKNFIKKALQEKLIHSTDLELLKKSSSKNGEDFYIKNAEIKKVYDQMVLTKEISQNNNFEKVLIARKIRTLSGVAVIAVLTKPYPCPGKCLYCPSEKSMPKSYLSNEPAVMRAIAFDFHPYKQTQARIRALALNGHQTDKIELIVMGGTFSYFPSQYQNWFIQECFRAANDYPINKLKIRKNPSLEKEKVRNEHARNRIIGLTLETRPDYINEKEVKKFRKLGATRVELGVQTIFDNILKKNRRGHLTEETIKATKLLKNAGFKIGYHLMPGLLGSTLNKDLQIFKTIFSNQQFQPDLIKIYPCVVTRTSKLFHLWKNKKYRPLSNETNKKLTKRIKKIIPAYVRISRLIRDIPEESIVAGPNISNMRQLIQQEGTKCKCIRCREVKGSYSAKEKIILDRIDYPASDGKEVFLQFVSPDKNKLYALLRLRIPDQQIVARHFLSELKSCALIREVHTYGEITGIDKKNDNSPQHIGLGKKLLAMAEKLAKDEFGFNKIAVISGVGVRGYYKKFGYHLENEYMIKNLE